MKSFIASRSLAAVTLLLLTGCLDGLNPTGNQPVDGSVPAKYTVTYASNGSQQGAVPAEAVEYEEGAVVAVLGNTGNLLRAGYAFSGWNTAADGSGTAYSGGATFTMPSASVVLYAQWAVVTYSVSYNGNGSTEGSPPVDPRSPYSQGDSVTVLGNSGSLVRTGYSFAGWNTAANGSGTSYAPAATFTMPPNAVTLYAQWAATYSVSYDGNGSTGGLAPIDLSSPYVAGATVTVAGNTGNLLRAGYTFTGWNTSANGSGNAYAAASTFSMPSSNVTLYAQWSANQYAVTYDGNGNTAGLVPIDLSSPYATDATVTVYGNTGLLVRVGFTFSGWNTSANGSGTAYAPAATFTMPPNAVTLYAQWAATYSVSYDGNGNTAGLAPIDLSSPYTVGSTVTVLGNSGLMVRLGYTFTGWNTSANGSGTAYSATSTFSMPSSNVTLYAQWSANQYAVTYNGNGNTAGLAPIDPSSPYATDSTVTVRGNTGLLVRTGFTFSGWNTAANGSGTSYAPAATFTMPPNAVTLYAQWAATYSVSYDGNGSTAGLAPIDPSSPYVAGATVTVAGNTGNLLRAGYTFTGWNTSANGSGNAYSTTSTFSMPSSNVTLYAQWSANQYAVTYNGNGNTAGLAPIDPSSPYATDATVTVHGNTGLLVRTGFTFSGWNTSANGSGTAYAPAATFTMPPNAVTLYAQWAATYSVSYDGNGSTGGLAPIDPSSPYVAGATVTVAGNTGNLLRAGYTFTGWNTSANGSGNAYAAASTFTMPSSNVTLYAQWSANQYAVTYNGNGSTGGLAPIDPSSPYATDATVTVHGNTGLLVRTGFTFSGWNTAANGSGTAYAAAATFTMPPNAVTLYAQWAATYSVSYDGNGNTAGLAPIDLSSPYTVGSTVTVLGNSGLMVRLGYTFTGWNTSANGSGNAYAAASTFSMPSSNVTLYAQWSANQYAVTYNGNGNTAGLAPIDPSSPYATDSTVTVAGNTGNLLRAGYAFSGWNTSANGSGTAYAPAATFTMPPNAVTLYAQWAATYSVSYDGNGSTGGLAPIDPSSPYVAGATVTVAGNAGNLLRTGYTFTGWNTSANGSGNTYAAASTFSMPSSNVTLYAQWAATYSVTYNGNGSTGGLAPIDPSSPYTVGSTVTVLGNSGLMVRLGYTFTGWNTSANGSGNAYAAASTFSMPSSNVTLYAQWSANQYAVTYNGNGNTAGLVPIDPSSPYATDSTVTVAGNTGNLLRAGYAFSGWNTSANGSGTAYAAASTFTMPPNAVTLYAQWSATYSVTYNGNGNTAGLAPIDPSSPYVAGATVTVLGNSGLMVRLGYTFTGWNTSANGSGNAYAAASTFSMPSSNVTLYAQWSANQYAVTYNGNGNTAGLAPIDPSSPYATDSTVTVRGNTGLLVRTGFTFSGWNTAANGSGTAYAPMATFTMPPNAVTLYAQWAATYSVTYNGNGSTAGLAPIDLSSPYVAGATVTVAGNTGNLLRAGYAFSGWNTSANGSGNAYAAASTFTMPSSNVTLYAQWAAVQYTVTYNGNSNTGGTVPVDNSTYTLASSVTVLGNTGSLTKTGYSFAGWNTLANGSGTTYQPGSTFPMLSTNVNLYAVWVVNRTITFNANGGMGTMAPQVIGTGLSAPLTTNGFTRTSYSFVGWATSAGGGVAYNDKQEYTMGSVDVTLYAVWTLNGSLAVNYNFNEQNANDLSGNAKHGTTSGITYVSDGAGGYAASLNGVSSYISMPNDLIRNTPNFTMMIRFKCSPLQYGTLLGYQNTAVGTTPPNYVPILTVLSDGRLRGELWVGTAMAVLSSGAVNDGQWHTAYFSGTPGSIKLFLDGVQIGSSSGTVQNLDMSYNQLGTGRGTGRTLMPNAASFSNTWFYFNGLIDDFYFYTTAL